MASMPPGWYPDPSSPYQVRWWDGRQWTHFTTATPQAQQQHFNRIELTSSARTEFALRRWARAALCCYPVVLAIQITVGIITIHRVRNLVDQFNTQQTSFTTLANNFNSSYAGLRLVNDATEFALLPVAVVFLVWMFHAAKVARDLGYPAQRSPGLGVGSWFIPIVNFWFPYQALRDLLPPAHPARHHVLPAWLCYIGTGVLTTTSVVVAYFSQLASVIPLVCAAGTLATAIALGWRLIGAVADDHRRALADAGLPMPPP